MLTVKNVATSLERALFLLNLGKLLQLTCRGLFVIAAIAALLMSPSGYFFGEDRKSNF